MRNNRLFVRTGDVETLQIFNGEDVGECFGHFGKIKVAIDGIQSEFRKFFREIGGRKTVAEGMAKESECLCHKECVKAKELSCTRGD